MTKILSLSKQAFFYDLFARFVCLLGFFPSFGTSPTTYGL